MVSCCLPLLQYFPSSLRLILSQLNTYRVYGIVFIKDIVVDTLKYQNTRGIANSSIYYHYLCKVLSIYVLPIEEITTFILYF